MAEPWRCGKAFDGGHADVIKLRQRRCLEAGIDEAMATGYEPLGNDGLELARTMAASVQQRIAFGEWAGQQVRRIGSGFGYEGEHPALTSPRCARVNDLLSFSS